MYLKDLGFSEEVISLLNKSLPDMVLSSLEKEEKVVTANINYLKDLGVHNYVDAFVNFYNMFLIDTNSFDEIFSKYDREDLVAKLEKNVAIMEYL
jgi:hypothetical protein